MISNNQISTTKAIKRVLRDLSEVQSDPIPGISICMPDVNNPLILHGNIEIKDGLYEGLIIHLIFHIPPEYPLKPPAVNISPGLQFGHKYHHHIYDDNTHGNSICTDITSNFAGHFKTVDASGNPIKSGWTPAYTLSSVLMQLQVFFTDPDMPSHQLPSQEAVEKLWRHITDYKIDIRVQNESENCIITHSFDKPYPPLIKQEAPKKEDVPAPASLKSAVDGDFSSCDWETYASLDSSEESKVEEEKGDIIRDDAWHQVQKKSSTKKSNNSNTDILRITANNETSSWRTSQKQGTPIKAPQKTQQNTSPTAENKPPTKPMSLFERMEKAKLERQAQEEEKIKKEKELIFSPASYFQPDPHTSPERIRQEVKNKLVCSVTKVDVFDESKPILGYPIDLEKDSFGRIWPTPIMEVLSYDAFVSNIQQNSSKLDQYHTVKFQSSFGAAYNYWLPVYIDDEHFERSKQHIFNSIATIFAGVEGTKENDFRPEMALKVLPPILVKTAIHFLKGTIHQSLVGIETYCQLYRLLAKLIEIFPELQEQIEKEVENFCGNDEKFRHKRTTGELGDFFIKLCLSSKGTKNKGILDLLMREHFTRQASWTVKADKGLKYQQKCPNFLERFMIASQISNQFFLVKLETAKLLLDEKVKKDMDQRCGLLNEKTMELFRARLVWISKNINKDWKMYIEACGHQQFIKDEKAMSAYILKAFELAKSKGYMY